MPLHSQSEHQTLIPNENIEDSNRSNNPEFADIVGSVERRSFLKGGAGLTAAAFFGSLPLVGCTTMASTTTAKTATTLKRPKSLKFTAVPHYTGGDMLVADGYNARVILPLGTPLVDGIDEWKDDRMHAGESFKYRMGDNHDGMWFFGMTNGKYDVGQSERGLLAMNHEYTNPNLNPVENYTKDDPSAKKIYQKRRLATDVRREIHAHGVSVVELKRTQNGDYELVKNSPFNKRYTSGTQTKISGVAKGHELIKTKLDPKGLTSVGINNQCGAGLSPWGTYLTTEELLKRLCPRRRQAHHRRRK